MSEVTKPILLDETGQSIVTKLDEIKNAILSEVPAGEPVRITVVTPPTTTEYTIGDTVDLTGIEVCAIFTNNAVIDITDQCTFSPAQGEVAAGNVITASWTWEPTPQTFTATTPIEVEYVTWGSGTPTQLAAMLEAHYAGLIDIHDYWNVGDERTIALDGIGEYSGIDGTDYVDDATMTFVLMHEGGKELVEPIHGVDECAFIVGQKEILSKQYVYGHVHMNSTATNIGGWKESARRTWCNGDDYYRGSFATSGMKPLFKLFKNVQSAGGAAPSTADITQDYFALPTEKEVTGSCVLSNSTAEGDGVQFDYYKNTANRVKKGYFASATVVGGAQPWWLRSAGFYPNAQESSFCMVWDDGTTGEYAAHNANDDHGISPFGVI